MSKKINFNNLIMAHRGVFNNRNIPENSLLSFKKALSLNYAIELDIEMTKDCKIIVFHDSNLKRMTGINKRISNLNYSEIEKLHLLNTSEKIPSIEKVLKLVNGKVLINIEIKRTNSYKLIIDELLKLLSNYGGEYIIQSFDPRAIIYLRKKYPGVIRGLLISGPKSRIFYNAIISFFCREDFISINKRLVNRYKNLISKYPTFIWTIKSTEELDKYFDKYNGYICDNLPY